MSLEVMEATPEHLSQVEADIRMEDLKEWYGMTGKRFSELAFPVLREPGYKRVALLSGVPVVFWGMDEEGNVWLYATDWGAKNALGLHVILRPEMDKMLDLVPRLAALSDDRNRLHHKWLKWLGFTFIKEEFMPPFGLPYKLFIKEREPCASQSSD